MVGVVQAWVLEGFCVGGLGEASLSGSSVNPHLQMNDSSVLGYLAGV